MNSIKEIAKVLKKSKKIAIFSHDRPDYDALGSTYALYFGLKSLGKEVSMFQEENIPETYKTFFDDDFITYGQCDSTDFDTFICCDVSSLNRLGIYASLYNYQNNTIVFDHHITTKLIGKYNYVDASMSSCSEMVYDLLKMMKVHFSTKILSYIYIGLSSDTKSFINNNTNEHSFKVAYEILKFGVDTTKINDILYRSIAKKEVDFQKYLWNNYKIEKNIAYLTMDNKTLQSLGGDFDMCSGFSGKLIKIEGIKYAFSLIEREPGIISLSMRSRAGYNCRSIAEKLGGGGHFYASGATIKSTSFAKVRKEVIKTIKDDFAEKKCQKAE